MTPLRAADFDFHCPPALVAQHPPAVRGTSRLMALNRSTGTIRHQSFADFPALLAPGDCLVVNESRVIPARLRAIRDNGRPAEILLVHEEADGTWQAMVHPGGKLKAGRKVWFEAGAAEAAGPWAEMVEVLGGGLRRVRFHGADAREVMGRYGAVPLPPYITRPPEASDAERYQTVYARTDGSVAAPTAGLHFTPEILAAIRGSGVTITEVTLHVGPGTFKPVEVDDLAQHVMHAEWYDIPEHTTAAVQRAKADGKRVWAVGTTACRVLESATAGSGWTSLFLYPGSTFTTVNGLLTNFHLPRSTLLMLVAAFAGHDLTMNAYRQAVTEGYRLYSYGDAMVVQ